MHIWMKLQRANYLLRGNCPPQIEQWQELLGRFVVDQATSIQLALIDVLAEHCLTLVREVLSAVRFESCLSSSCNELGVKVG